MGIKKFNKIVDYFSVFGNKYIYYLEEENYTELKYLEPITLKNFADMVEIGLDNESTYKRLKVELIAKRGCGNLLDAWKVATKDYR